VNSIALMMEAIQTSETSVNSCQSTLCYNPEDSHLHRKSCLSNNNFNIIPHLRLRLSSGVSHSGFPITILYAFLISAIRHTCFAHCVFPVLIIVIIFGIEHELWSSLLWIFLQPRHIIPLGPNILLSILFSNTFSHRSSFNIRYQVLHPSKQHAKL
jgi:hypothetical protein